jgi:hypothetical protein
MSSDDASAVLLIVSAARVGRPQFMEKLSLVPILIDDDDDDDNEVVDVVSVAAVVRCVPLGPATGGGVELRLEQSISVRQTGQVRAV